MQQQNGNLSLQQLPTDVLSILFEFLINEARDCARLEAVSKSLFALINNDQYAHNIWVKLIVKSTSSDQNTSGNSGNNSQDHLQHLNELINSLAAAAAANMKKGPKATTNNLLSKNAHQAKLAASYKLTSHYRTVLIKDAVQLAQHNMQQRHVRLGYAEMLDLKVLVRGAEGVGKTCFIIKYITWQFVRCFSCQPKSKVVISCLQ